MQRELDDQIRLELTKRKDQWREISRASTVSYDWIRTFVRGDIPNPGINTLRKLRDYFKNGKK